MHVYVLRWLAVVSDCIGARVENDMRPVRHKQYTHTGIAYAHITAPHSWCYIVYLCYLEHDASSSKKNQLWLLVLEYVKFSLPNNWNNFPHPCRTVIAYRNKYRRPPENTPLGLITGYHGRDISYNVHSFIDNYKNTTSYLAYYILFSTNITHPLRHSRTLQYVIETHLTHLTRTHTHTYNHPHSHLMKPSWPTWLTHTQSPS